MKLELKYLAPYLPYGLRVQMTPNTICEVTIRRTASEYISLENLSYLPYKPILRPLSDLTKEINHKGEIFTPTSVLEIDRDLDFEIYTENDFVYVDILEMYRKTEKLFEWHFDVFGLIEKGLAIDINSISKNA